MTKHRKSYGIALCRYNGPTPEIIFVKKRYTYYFFEFVLGKYQKNDNKYLIKLFNNMTYQEKMDILSLKFDTIWYKIWLEVPGRAPITQRDGGFNEKRYAYSYSKSKNKFESNFLMDGGKRLKKLINDSNNVETLWEIPRGHKTPNEKEIDAAIREFSEETMIDVNKYSILWYVAPVVVSYKDGGVVYRTIYYIAAADLNIKEWTPKVYFNSYDQILEVEAIKWMSINDINMLMVDAQSKKRLIKLFKTITVNFKNSCKSI